MALPELLVPEPLPPLAQDIDLKAQLLQEHECIVVRQAHSSAGQRAEAQRVATQKAPKSQGPKNSDQEYVIVVAPDTSAQDPAIWVTAQNLRAQLSGVQHFGAVSHIVGQSVAALERKPVRGSADPVVLVVVLSLSRAVAL